MINIVSGPEPITIYHYLTIPPAPTVHRQPLKQRIAFFLVSISPTPPLFHTFISYSCSQAKVSHIAKKILKISKKIETTTFISKPLLTEDVIIHK